MNASVTSHASCRRERGLSTIDALIAAAVLGLGMLGLARLHGDLRHNAEAARERSEAVRLAQQELEALRAFPTVADWAASVDAGPAEVTPSGTTTRYLRERNVRMLDDLDLKAVRVTLRWSDRRGAPQSLSLQTLIAGTDPALAGALMLPRPDL